MDATAVKVIAGLAGLIAIHGSLERRVHHVVMHEARSAFGAQGTLDVRTRPGGVFGLFGGDIASVLVEGSGEQIEGVPFQVEPGRGSTGSIGHLRLRLTDVKLSGLPVKQLSMDVPHVVFDMNAAVHHDSLKLRGAGIGKGTVTVAPEGLQLFIGKKFESILSDVRVTISEGKVTVAATLGILHTPVSVTGVLVARDGRYLDVADAALSLNGAQEDAATSSALMTQFHVNPVLDVRNDLHLDRVFTIASVNLDHGAVTIDGPATLPQMEMPSGSEAAAGDCAAIAGKRGMNGLDANLRQTPLHAAHIELGARMVDYAGWEMPVLYTGIIEETRAVRTNVGLFDISHMGRIRLSGDGATALLQSLTTNDVEKLAASEACYSLLTNSAGGIIDDIIVYREAPESYLVVINASNTAKDIAWIESHRSGAVTLDDMTTDTAMIAVQGPHAPQLVAELAGRPELLELNRFQYAAGTIAGAAATMCRTGYTGEDGFELIVPAADAPAVWNALLAGGAVACGLGARDALRIEAGYPLYGHEIDDTTTPVEAGLMWVVRLDKGEFTGREPIAARKAAGAPRRLMGLVSAERIQPRQGYTVYSGGAPCGEVTSGVFSPTRGGTVAMAYIDKAAATVGAVVEIAIRDKRVSAQIVMKKDLLKPS